MKRLLLFTLLLTTITFAPSVAQAPAPPAEREYNFKMTRTELIWVVQSLGLSDQLSAKKSNELAGKLQSQFYDTTLNKQ